MNTRTVRFDTTAPITGGAVLSRYYGSALITFTPTDAASGVALTRFRVDGGAWTTGTTVSLTDIGNHTLDCIVFTVETRVVFGQHVLEK